jgi:hypothetical protein
VSDEIIIAFGVLGWSLLLFKPKITILLKKIFNSHRVTSNMNSTCNSSNDIEFKISQYKNLAIQYISPKAQEDERILNKALLNLRGGHTVEETLMTSCLFDITLQANEVWRKDIFVGAKIFASSVELLKVFKQWKDQKLISITSWERGTELIFNVANVGLHQKQAIDFVLSELNYKDQSINTPQKAPDISDDMNQETDRDDPYIKVADEIAAILRRQFFAIKKELNKNTSALKDAFSLAYILGFSDWYLQDWYRIQNEQVSSSASEKDFAILAIVFMQLYGMEEGSILCGKMFKSIDENNPEAIQGRTKGNADYLDMKNDRITPNGLFSRFEKK